MGERRRGYLLRLGGCGKNGNKRDENEPFLLLVVGVNSVVVFLCLFAWLLVPVLLRRGIYSTPQVGVRARWRVWERRSRQKWERRKDKDTVLLLLLLHSPFAYVSCSCDQLHIVIAVTQALNQFRQRHGNAIDFRRPGFCHNGYAQ